MPTRSDSPAQRNQTAGGAWNAEESPRRRSVFQNYAVASEEGEAAEVARPGRSAGAAGTEERSVAGLQREIDECMSRAFIYRYLAKAYEDPGAESWGWLASPETLALLRSGACHLSLSEAVAALASSVQPQAFESFQSACLAAFGHAARGPCPINEIEYGELKADPLFQPHRLADLAAFYRAFGLEISPGAGERQDHLCLELEFMCVLAAKEAYALEHQLDADELAAGQDAQKQFLREHLGRWVPAFARRVESAAAGSPLAALVGFTRKFIEGECARAGVRCGSEDLLLRPVDAAAESLCASCSLAELPPGAGTRPPHA